MDVEKTMEFILENRADVSVKQARTERQMHGIQNLFKMGARQLVSLAAAQKRTGKAVGELAVSQKRTAKAVQELAASQKRTDERFQRWLERGTNGRNRWTIVLDSP